MFISVDILNTISKIVNKDFEIHNLNEEVENKITDAWFKEGSFKTFKKPAIEKYEVAKEDGKIKTLEGEVSYKKGYFIMTGPKGEKYPVDPKSFAKLKDDIGRDENGKGTASPKKIIKMAKIADHDGFVDTSWGEKLNYKKGQDVIVRHGKGDYGVVKKDIFAKTYVKES